jgi:tetratricopeptide (TPR) repeat protein
MEKQAVQVALLVAGVFLAEIARAIGRTAFGLLAGLRVSRVDLGTGPLLLRRRVAGLAIALRAIPLALVVEWLPPARQTHMRLRFWLSIAGGPLACLAVLALFGAFGVHWRQAPPALAAWQSVVCGIIIQMIGRLIPFSMSSGGQKVTTDGLQLLVIPRAPQAAIEGAFDHMYLSAANDELAHGDPKRCLEYCELAIAHCIPIDVRVFRCLQAAAHFRLGDLATARAYMEESLAAAVPEPLHSFALNDWSWYAFRKRDEADLRLADRRSAEALGLRPTASSVQGTRGAMLLWRGRVTQAIPLLERSLQTAPTVRSRATEATLLAMAHASRGESVRAQSMLDGARRLNPQEALLDEAARYVQAAAGSLRVLHAARGRRALLVEPDGVDLLEGIPGGAFDDAVKLRAAAARRRRLTLSEIDEVSVRRGRSGRAHLIVRHDRSVWRLPLGDADLTWARMLADDVMNHPPLREATPPAVPLKGDRATKLLPWMTAAAMLLIMLGVPAGRDLASLTILSCMIALGLRPGVAPALALGTAALVSAVPMSHWEWIVDWKRGPWLAREGLLVAFGGLSLASAWFAAREARARDGIRLTIGLLCAALAWSVLITVVLAAHGRAYFIHAHEIVSAIAALAAVLIWRRRAARRVSV